MFLSDQSNDIMEWDRYSIRGEGGFIFGWIKRDDGFYDFVVVNFQLSADTLIVGYNTSSKKYSKEIGEILSKGVNLDYIECISASDFPEARLVSWQKKAAEQTPPALKVILSCAKVPLSKQSQAHRKL